MTSSYFNIERMAGYPHKYTPSRFFSKYSGAFLAPVYRQTAEKLSSRKTSFLSMWAWESDNIRKELNIEETLGDVQSYEIQQHSSPGISYRLSEVYRSAFLRTLAWFHFTGDLSEEAFRALSAMTIPIDLSFWGIDAQSPPTWWPRSIAGRVSQNDAEKILQASWSEIRTMVDMRIIEHGTASRRVLVAQGSLLGEVLQHESNMSVNFRLVGFGYKVVGSEVPHPHEIDSLISTSYGTPKSNSPHILSVLDALRQNSIAYSPYSWTAKSCLEVTALVSRLEPIPIYTWQWFRSFSRPVTLSPFFKLPGSDVLISPSSWSFASKGQELVRFYDWRRGALEKHSRVMFPSHGNVAEVDSDWLSERLDSAGLKLGHVLRVDLQLQNKSYEEAKGHRHVELIGVSRLISPVG